MADILKYNAYVPAYKVAAQDVLSFYAKPGRPRAKAMCVPSLDEDVVTMADAAARPLVESDTEVDAVIVATLSPPYYYKKVSPVLGLTLGLQKGLLCYDVTGSTLAGVDALQLAGNLVDVGDANKVLVVAADYIAADNGAECDLLPSAGAIAFVVGKDGFASLGARARYAADIFDVWRLPGDQQPRARLDVMGMAVPDVVLPALNAFFAKAGTSAADYAQVSLHEPHPNAMRGVAKAASKEQIANSAAFAKWGNFFSAQPLISLALALESAQPNDKVLAVAYGAGEAEAFEVAVKSEVPAVGLAQIFDQGIAIDVGAYWRFVHGRDGR